MSLREALQGTLSTLAVREDGDPAWRAQLRTALAACRDEIRDMLGGGHTVDYGMGYGAVAQVPWVVILKPGQAVRGGHYPVYLFARDGSAAFLSLNQGSELRSLSAIRESTAALRKAVGAFPEGFETSISLHATTSGPRKYEAANVGAFRYLADALPDDGRLGSDLGLVVKLSENIEETDLPEPASTGAAWIFQSSPEQYDLSGALESLSEVSWLVNQYPTKIHAGDRVYLWETGAEAGVVAVGEITAEPKMLAESSAEEPFWQSPTMFAGEHLRVPITIDDVAEPPISKARILSNPVLSNLPNLKFANATNYPITEAQEEELRRLMATGLGRRERRMTLKIAPGENASLWDDCLANGYIRVGWDELGDLRSYGSQAELKARFRDEYPNNAVASATRLWLMRQLQPGDLVIANQGGSRILAVGTVVEPGIDWLENVDSFRHIAHVNWDVSLARKLSPPVMGWRPTIREVDEELLCSILPELCEPRASEPDSLTFDWLERETLWDAERLSELVDAVRGGSPQLILAGPPGTGKTWVAQHLARFVTSDRKGRYRLVQFHPSYTYEQFIEGLRPVAKGGAIEFHPVDGVILDTVKKMADPDELTVIVIDEMNRANLSKVFGELMYLFEYRDAPIDLQYSTAFRLPRGLRFVGSMNTADRSIRSIDIALRRRFDIFDCPPDRAILERFYESRENLVPDLFDGFDALNAALTDQLDRHHTIGHTFFMANPMTSAKLEQVWRRKIGPLIDEYFFDQPDLASEYQVKRFWPSAS